MEIKFKVTGTAPLLMHGNILADPLSDAKKRMSRISGKLKKTDEDHIAISHIEFEAGLYFDPEVGPYMPGVNVAKSMLEAARIRKRGPSVERGLIVVSPINKLEYQGPRDISGLWSDLRFRHTVPAKTPPGKRGALIMRTRPKFPEWSFTATALTNPSVLSKENFAEILQDAGESIGLGDWRPWHGRFTSEVK